MTHASTTVQTTRVFLIVLAVICSGVIARAAGTHATAIPKPTPRPSPTPKPVPQAEFGADPNPVAATVTCDKSPGVGLCYALSDAIADYGNRCGVREECDAVYGGQSSSDSSILSQFEMDILPTDSVSQEIGKMAFNLASSICKGNDDLETDSYGYQVTVVEIKLLPRLLFLQKAAGVTNPKSCKISTDQS